MSKKIINPQDTQSKQQEFDLGLYQIELLLENKVIADIRKRQRKISGLRQDSLGYTATWGGEMTPGCRTCCLQGRWTQIRTTTKCNLNCSFCYYFKAKGSLKREMIPHDRYMISRKLFTENDVKLLFEVQGEKFLNGVAWLHFEPLMEIDKMLSLMRFIHKKGYHQWLYTNGVFAIKENLKKLADSGLNEIRFNLAATNCSDVVIRNMRNARKYFKYVCIESPMFTTFYNSFMKKKSMILDTGVDHIHFAELQLLPKTKDNFRDEGTIYRHKGAYVSPIKSRQLTYNVFETAALEGWKNVVLHDCSNETKFFRGVNAYSATRFGGVGYFGSMKLDKEFYRDALRYLKMLRGKKRKSYGRLLSRGNSSFVDPSSLYPIYLKLQDQSFSA